MKFKEFLNIDEIFGQYGNIGSFYDSIGSHMALRNIIAQPVPTQQSRVRRSLAAGKCKNPNRPVIRIIPNKQMALKSVL